MAKPRIFISSTYYDLKYIRSAIEDFINNIGYEAILFEKGSIPFQHDKLLEESCLSEVGLADMFVLIVGGRYGSLSIDDSTLASNKTESIIKRIRSVTEREYERAKARSIPIFIFVESAVLAEHKTFQKNRHNLKVSYAHVDDHRIFEIIDGIFSQQMNNYVKGFERVDEITSWLRIQWAGLFADALRSRSNNVEINNLSFQIGQLGSTIKSLETYAESIVKQNSPDAEQLIALERLRQKERLEDAVIDTDPIKWFIMHENTKEIFKVKTRAQRRKILDAVQVSDGLIEFLSQMSVEDDDLIDAIIGVETTLTDEYLDLKRSIAAVSLNGSKDSS